MNRRTRLMIARICISLVLFFNLQCAFQFLNHPEFFLSGFELTGVSGNAMVRGMGLLFIMWNVPYIFALLHPVNNRISLIEALIMQMIGVAGETFLLSRVPASHLQLLASVRRFILFDGFGLLLLWMAYGITRKIILNSLLKPANRADNY